MLGLVQDYSKFRGYLARVAMLYDYSVALNTGTESLETKIPQTPNPVFELNGCDVATPKGEVLISNLNLTLQPGRNIIIMGPNGKRFKNAQHPGLIPLRCRIRKDCYSEINCWPVAVLMRLMQHPDR